MTLINKLIVKQSNSKINEIKKEKSNFIFEKINDQILFSHNENQYNDFEQEILLPYKQSTLGPHISKADLNGDKIDDFYIGGAFNQEVNVYSVVFICLLYISKNKLFF